jgi:hypothetical protein
LESDLVLYMHWTNMLLRIETIHKVK